ncbi:MAG: hypothetical protein ACLFR1_06855 [Spirochaetia bacterium]
MENGNSRSENQHNYAIFDFLKPVRFSSQDLQIAQKYSKRFCKNFTRRMTTVFGDAPGLTVQNVSEIPFPSIESLKTNDSVFTRIMWQPYGEFYLVCDSKFAFGAINMLFGSHFEAEKKTPELTETSFSCFSYFLERFLLSDWERSWTVVKGGAFELMDVSGEAETLPRIHGASVDISIQVDLGDKKATILRFLYPFSTIYPVFHYNRSSDGLDFFREREYTIQDLKVPVFSRHQAIIQLKHTSLQRFWKWYDAGHIRIDADAEPEFISTIQFGGVIND